MRYQEQASWDSNQLPDSDPPSEEKNHAPRDELREYLDDNRVIINTDAAFVFFLVPWLAALVLQNVNQVTWSHGSTRKMQHQQAEQKPKQSSQQ